MSGDICFLLLFLLYVHAGFCQQQDTSDLWTQIIAKRKSNTEKRGENARFDNEDNDRPQGPWDRWDQWNSGHHGSGVGSGRPHHPDIVNPSGTVNTGIGSPGGTVNTGIGNPGGTVNTGIGNPGNFDAFGPGPVTPSPVASNTNNWQTFATSPPGFTEGTTPVIDPVHIDHRPGTLILNSSPAPTQTQPIQTTSPPTTSLNPIASLIGLIITTPAPFQQQTPSNPLVGVFGALTGGGLKPTPATLLSAGQQIIESSPDSLLTNLLKPWTPYPNSNPNDPFGIWNIITGGGR